MFAVALTTLALAATPLVGTKGIGTFGVKDDLASFFTVSLQKELLAQGVELVVRPDADVPGQAPVCGEGKACAFIIRGTLAQIGDKARLELELVAPDGKRVARHSALAADAASLVDQVSELAKTLAAEIASAGTAPVAAAPVAAAPAPADAPSATALATGEAPKWWWAPLVLGVVFAGAGGGFFAVAASDHDSLIGGHAPSPLYTYEDGKAIASQGRLFDTLAWVGIGIAGAAAVTSVAIWYFGRSTPVALAVTPNGAYASLEWHW